MFEKPFQLIFHSNFGVKPNDLHEKVVLAWPPHWWNVRHVTDCKEVSSIEYSCIEVFICVAVFDLNKENMLLSKTAWSFSTNIALTYNKQDVQYVLHL